MNQERQKLNTKLSTDSLTNSPKVRSLFNNHWMQKTAVPFLEVGRRFLFTKSPQNQAGSRFQYLIVITKASRMDVNRKADYQTCQRGKKFFTTLAAKWSAGPAKEVDTQLIAWVTRREKGLFINAKRYPLKNIVSEISNKFSQAQNPSAKNEPYTFFVIPHHFRRYTKACVDRKSNSTSFYAVFDLAWSTFTQWILFRRRSSSRFSQIF